MDGQGGHQLQGARGPAASLGEELAQMGNPKNPWGERFMADGVGGQARAVSLSAWPKPIGLGGNERPVQDTELCWV